VIRPSDKRTQPVARSSAGWSIARVSPFAFDFAPRSGVGSVREEEGGGHGHTRNEHPGPGGARFIPA